MWERSYKAEGYLDDMSLENPTDWLNTKMNYTPCPDRIVRVPFVSDDPLGGITT